MLLNPAVYAELLSEKIDEDDTEVYLINTGWVDGAYGKGNRVNLSYTKEMVNAVIGDKFKDVKFNEHPLRGTLCFRKERQSSTNKLNRKLYIRLLFEFYY